MPENLPPINEEMCDYEVWRRSTKSGWHKVAVYLEAESAVANVNGLLAGGIENDKCAIYRVERSLLVTYKAAHS